MPLQKLFSEQNSNAGRQQWQRSRSHPNGAGQSRAGQQHTSRPAVPVSAMTKSKLQAFHFQPQAQTRNDVSNGATCAFDPCKTSENKAKHELAVTSTDSVSGDKDGAENSLATPAPTRMAWQDLMSTQDGSSERSRPKGGVDEDAESPSERLLWHIGRDHNPSSAMMTPLLPQGRTQRSRKRARSSSPTSPATPAVIVPKLANEVRAPQADPAMELWHRFALPGTANETKPLSDVTDPILGHLMMPPSPKPQDGQARSTSSRAKRWLRKTVSCGSNWAPNKRRKIEHWEATPDWFLGRRRGGQADGTSKTHMVKALLETVNVGLNKAEPQAMEEQDRAKHESGASSSLPISPTRPRSTRTDSPQQPRRQSPRRRTTDSSDSMGGEERSATTGTRATAADKASDYGDDDFDDDALLEMDASLTQVRAEDVTLATRLNGARSGTGQQAAPSGQPKPDAVVVSAEDFEDLDDDLFDGAEALLAEAESRHVSQQAIRGKTAQTALVLSDDGFGDEFGGKICLESVRSAARAGTNANLPLLHASRRRSCMERYQVVQLVCCTYKDDRDRDCPDKVIVLQPERPKAIRVAHLRDDWYDTPVSVKSFVHVDGIFDESGVAIIDNNRGIIILHPDQLISATVVADSFACMRRAVLQDRVKAAGELAPALVYGTILHEVFQRALLANEWDSKFLDDAVQGALATHLEDLYVIKVSVADARRHLLSKMTELQSWAASFVAAAPRPDAAVQGRNGRATMCVSKLLDVEERVWSPAYGLKGNIDATVQVTMRDVRHGSSRTLTVPLELKTGSRTSTIHQAQTALYSLLLSDRYDIDVACGVLYYMETSQTLHVPAVRHELRHMVMQRNRLACFVSERRVQLPAVKRSKTACGQCAARTSCFIYHKLADDGDGDTSGMGPVFDAAVSHLTPRHRAFFLQWDDLLTKEEKESHKLRRELWTMVSTEREKLGRCFANVVIDAASASHDSAGPRIHRHQYTFVKEKPPPGFSFLDSQLGLGEPVVVSDEHGHFALALGYVSAVTKKRISVAVDRRLHNARLRQPGFDDKDNQVFSAIMEVAPAPQTATSHERRPSYRLDKDEFSNGMATVRNNLVHIMADGPPGSRDIRRLVVDLEPPRFRWPSSEPFWTDHDGLNVDQKKAVCKVMAARDYALVLGMPGTGKTTTIAHIIRALTAQAKSILLASYTHSAVDNILLKLKRDNMPILRLGAAAKVHPEVQGFATLANQPMSTLAEMHAAWHDTAVVATTCLGISHPLLRERIFDYCIVDEASQITLPICLGPIRLARTFVLVGDHNQLPPLVQSDEARAGGLDVSLFKLLSDAHPASVVSLEHQYRMCEDVMALSNTLIYNGRLKCGTDQLRSRSLYVPDLGALRARHVEAASILAASQRQKQSLWKTCARSSAAAPSFCPGARPGCWLRDLIEPQAHVRFVDTDALRDAAREEARGNRIVNHCEATIVSRLVECLLLTGVPAADIGVMTHYRSQLALLRRAVSDKHVEMHTADRFQGRDKEVMVLSLVRSNEAGSIGELLKDWRRINVAFTRAKTKLLVVGSRETLRKSSEGGDAMPMLARFVTLMDQREWVYHLPPHALEGHLFASDTATQGATPTARLPSPCKEKPAAVNRRRRSPLKNKAGASEKRLGSMTVLGKENDAGAAATRRVGISERAVFKNKPVSRDIWNELTDGMFDWN